MYVPGAFAEPRRAVLFDFIEQHPLGTLVTNVDGVFEASHLPFLVHRDRGPDGTLQAHLARANSHARAPHGSSCLVIFIGVQGYLSPSWYAAKAEHGKVVPTWDYIAVHATGIMRTIDDSAALRAHLETLTTRFESPRAAPWSVDDAPPEFIERQMRAIVGVEIEVARLEGKWKLSQNRSDPDIDGVIAGLNGVDDAGARDLARAISTARPRHQS